MVDFVVVFDIDKTLLPGIGVLLKKRSKTQDLKQLYRDIIAVYKHRGYGLAINTARLWIPSYVKKFLRDVSLDIDALPRGAVQTGGINSRMKLKRLKRIQAAYGDIPAERVIFYDDRASNINRAKEHGFVAVQVSKDEPFPLFLFN